MKKPLMLMILDGWGYSESDYGNAIRAARTPNLDRIAAQSSRTLIEASGLSVGLPEGQMGNSEVGHTNIGAGRVVYQELYKIGFEVQSGEFFENPALVKAMDNAKNGALHLLGLVSDGGVHSHFSQLVALLEMAKKRGVANVYVHCFTDGRDVPPTSAEGFIESLVGECARVGVGRIATIMGRYYAMDRDNRFERLVRAYDAMVFGEGTYNPDPVAAVRESYANGVTDEFIEPVVCDKNGTIKAGDSVVFFNFRPDRAREITRALVDDNFNGFERRNGRFPLEFVCFTQYDATMPNVSVAFAPQSLENTFGQYISDMGLNQLRIAETEKYAHVTFFFNGGRELQYKNEDRILVASPKVATYDLQPEMSAYEVADKVVEALGRDVYDVIILNFANCDMVGHTGIFDAAVSAVEAVDKCAGLVADKMRELDGILLVTADHGNADKMLDENGEPFTAHTTNPVPFWVYGREVKLRDGGILADIAPTMLELLGLSVPSEMGGKSLIEA